MHVTDATWAIRPAGSDTWVDIDPNSPRGRRLAAAFGIPQKEDHAMSAIPVSSPATLRVVESNREQMGLLLTVKAKARAAFDFMVSVPKSAWGWVKRTLHLEAAEERLNAIRGWIKAKALWVGRLLGKTGLAGAGMLAVSTPHGRKVLGWIVKPFVATALTIHDLWVKAEDTILDEDGTGKIAAVRNWVAGAMMDARVWAFGVDGLDDSYGFFGNLAIKALVKVGPYLALDSKTMLLTRGVGMALLGSKLFTLAALLPAAGWVVFAAQAVVVLVTFVGAGDPLLAVLAKAGKDTKVTKTEVKEAAKVAETVTTVPPVATPKAAANAAASNGQPSNRAAKRAAKRQPASR